MPTAEMPQKEFLHPSQSPTKLHTLSGLRLGHTNFTRPKPLLLLAYLCIEGKKDKRFLAELFWPGASNHLNSLAKALSQLRQVGVIDNDDTHAWATINSDVNEFLFALEQHDLETAGTLYQDSFLSGFYLPDWGVELEEWIYTTREFLASRMREVLLELAEASKDINVATQYAERAYELDATLEPDLIGRLFKFLANTPHAAKLRREAKEFGISLERPKTIVSNLPSRGTSFIGRDIERLELAELLIQHDVRMVTVVGQGGVGKTRLALEVAREIEDHFPDGIVYFPVENLTTPEQMLAGLAVALSVQLTQEDCTEQLPKIIGDKRVLLLMDSMEYQVESAYKGSVFLARCPNLKILNTSRVRLNLEEEWVYTLEGFSLPEKNVRLEEAQHHDAVSLFVQRARKVKPGFTLNDECLPFILNICERVQGLPLGIELAASWVKVLSCQEIAQQLDEADFLATSTSNIPERHQSLRNVFEGSWQLLSPEEQIVLSKLSVFHGGFTREAAREVTRTNLMMLARLGDKSLLRVTANNCYEFHPLLQGYLQEKLAQGGHEADTRLCHAHYFLSVAEAMKTKSGAEIFQRLETDLGNFRASFFWFLDREETRPRALSLFCLLSRMFMSYGYVREGREWVKGFLTFPADVSWPWADALHIAGSLARIQGELQGARELYTRSRELWQRLGDKDNEAKVTGNLAIVYTEEGQYALAGESYELVLAHFKNSGNTGMVVAALVNLGTLHHQQGNFQKARAFYEECLKLCQEQGNKRILTACLTNLAEVSYDEGNYPVAMQYALDALDLLRDLGDKGILAETLVTVGKVTLELGNLSQARAYLRESLELYHNMADKPGLVVILETFATLALSQGKAREAVCLWAVIQKERELLEIPVPPRKRTLYDQNLLETKKILDEAVFTLAWSKGSVMRLEEAITLALKETSKND